MMYMCRLAYISDSTLDVYDYAVSISIIEEQVFRIFQILFTRMEIKGKKINWCSQEGEREHANEQNISPYVVEINADFASLGMHIKFGTNSR